MNQIKISAVSYLNTRPFLHGINNHEIKNQIQLSLDIPSVIASKLKRGEAQIGLLPVAFIPQLNKANIISDFCIGSNGPVDTVCLYAQVPVTELKNIYLDYQSESSVRLIKILMRDYWKQEVNWMSSNPGYEMQIENNTGGLIIGDRNFGLRNHFKFRYDLSECWKELTQLPFIFACWVSAIDLEENFVQSLNAALKAGVESIDAVCDEVAGNYPGVDVKTYLTNHIVYKRNDEMMAGYNEFMKRMKGL